VSRACCHKAFTGGSFEPKGSLLFAEFSEATNNTFVELIAATYLVKTMNGVTLILLGTTLRHAWITPVRVLGFDRASAVRDREC
jgi:hypothetical protein